MVFTKLRNFATDAKASMATQVVVFSVLLFGTSGVVIDFGRVYNEHSKMQAFTDQAALAAASELDGGSDAITRAVEAVYGNGTITPIAKNALYSEGDGDTFGISHLYFLSELTRDGGPQYDLSDDLAGPNLLHVAYADGGSAGGTTPEQLADLSTQAEFVVAIAAERSVRNGLMQMINATGTESVREKNVVRTIAAAQRRQIACGSLSNLVICNPWENDTGQSFESVVADPANVGFQALHVADGVIDANTGALSAPNSLARRFELEGAADVRRICDNASTIPGGSLDETSRAICYLAAAAQSDFCVADNELAFTAATANEITTAMSAAFDMWDEPLSDVLTWDVDADGKHSQTVLLDAEGQPVLDAFGQHIPDYNPATASRRGDSSIFQPDQNILKARVWDPERAEANAVVGIPASSRRNYVPHPQADNYNLNLSRCLRNGETNFCMETSDGDVIDYIGEPTTFTSVVEYYISNYRNLFRRTFQPPSASIDSFYKAYQEEIDEWLVATEDFPTATGQLVAKGDSNAWTGEDGSLAAHIQNNPNTADLADTLQLQIAAAHGFCDNNLDGVPDGEYCDVNEAGPDGVLPTGPVRDAGFDPGQFVVDPITNEYVHIRGDTMRSTPNYTYWPETFPGSGALDPVVFPIERRVFDVTVINCGTTEVGDDGISRAEVAGFAKMFMLQPPRPFCAGGGDDCANPLLQRAEIYSEFVGGADITPEAYAVLVR